MKPSKYDIAEWILDSRALKDLTEKGQNAVICMRYGALAERHSFTLHDAFAILDMLPDKGFCPNLFRAHSMTDWMFQVDTGEETYLGDTIQAAVFAGIKALMEKGGNHG